MQNPAAIALPNIRLDPDLAVERVPIDALAPLGRKARHHGEAQLVKLEASTREFGFVAAIIIDEDNKVLAGHARVEVARRLQMTHVPALRVTHLTEPQKRAFILADNRLAELASWDKETLKAEFKELGILILDFELTVTGFEAPEIEAIVFDGEEHEDPLPTPPADPVSRVGDTFMLGDHRLLCGDATSPEAVDTLLEGQPVRAGFNDLPYNVRINGHVTGNAAHGEFVMASGEMSKDQFQAFLVTTCALILLALQPGGIAYLCMDWRHIAQLQAAAESAGGEVINLIVWDKKTGGMGSFYRSRHELILVVRKPGASHLNNVELGRHGRDRHNVWTYEGVNGFGKAKAATRAMHPTVKPLAMVRDALLDCSAKGDLILDLFGGSGTTLIAAEATGRRARMMELDPVYVDVIIRRFEDYTGKAAILAATGQTFAELRAERAASTDAEI